MVPKINIENTEFIKKKLLNETEKFEMKLNEHIQLRYRAIKNIEELESLKEKLEQKQDELQTNINEMNVIESDSKIRGFTTHLDDEDDNINIFDHMYGKY